MGKSRVKPQPLEIDPLEVEEARIATGERRRVFYHPGFGCNGVAIGGGKFQPHAAPPGWEFDVEAWIANGADGSAKLRRSMPDALFSRPVKEPEPEPDDEFLIDPASMIIALPVPDFDPESVAQDVPPQDQ